MQILTCHLSIDNQIFSNMKYIKLQYNALIATPLHPSTQKKSSGCIPLSLKYNQDSPMEGNNGGGLWEVRHQFTGSCLTLL